MNIQNDNNRCIEYCILRHLFPAETKKNSYMAERYTKYFVETQIKRNKRLSKKNQNIIINHVKIPEGQKYPIDIETDVEKYEIANDLKINVYKISNGDFYPIIQSNYNPKKNKDDILNLLLLTEEDNHHLCIITDISTLIAHLKTENSKNKCIYVIIVKTILINAKKMSPNIKNAVLLMINQRLICQRKDLL